MQAILRFLLASKGLPLTHPMLASEGIRILVHAILLLNAVAQNAPTPAAASSSPCLSRFFTHRAEFEPCKKQVCFLFLNQPPFVHLDPSMNTSEQQKLFACSKAKDSFPKLGGISFDIQEKIDFNSLCVWAGSECTFNDMTQFLLDRTNDPATSEYQFGGQGMIAQLQERISKSLRTTVTLSSDSFILIRRIGGGGSSNMAKMFEQMFRAFDLTTWWALFGTLMGLLLFAVIVSIAFSDSLSPLGVLMAMMGENEESENSSDASQRRRSTAVALVGTGFNIFFFLAILFYEIGIVNFIFNSSSETLQKPLHKSSDTELRAFGVLKGSGAENVLLKAVDPQGKKFKNKQYPWFQCIDRDACYKNLLDPKGQVKYLIVYKPEAFYEMQKRSACDSVIVLDTSNPSTSFGGTSGLPFGWFVSASVPLEVYKKLNQELLVVQLTGGLQKIVQGATRGVSNCGARKLSVAPQVIILPMAFMIGPTIFATLAVLIRYVTDPSNAIIEKDRDNEEDLEAVLTESSDSK